MTHESNRADDAARDSEMDAAIGRAMRAGANEPPILTQVAEAFSGRMGGINMLGVPMMFGLLGLAVWSGFRFFDATETRGMVMWATIFLFCSTSIGMFKMWYWMLMNRNAVTREVKRLELQVARLAGARSGT